MNNEIAYSVDQGISQEFWHEWDGCPGFRRDRALTGWVICWPDDNFGRWCLSALFARRRDAEIGKLFLQRRRVLPRDLQKMPESDERALIIELLSTLPW